MAERGINFDQKGGEEGEKAGSKRGLWPEIENLGVSDLLALRSQIDKRLPATELSELNLEKELVIHFLSVKELKDDAAEDDEVPANQKAQLMNSCAAMLSQMSKMQADLHNSERIKVIEQAVIEALRGLDDPEILNRFFAILEELLEKASPDGS